MMGFETPALANKVCLDLGQEKTVDIKNTNLKAQWPIYGNFIGTSNAQDSFASLGPLCVI